MTVVYTLTGDEASTLTSILGGEATLSVVRDVVTVHGPDAQKFLHSLVSQAVESLAIGDQGWSFLLQPQGKVLGLFTIERTEDQTFVLSTESGQGSTVATQLHRYKIRTKAEISLAEGVAQSCRVVDGVALFGDSNSDDCADRDGSLFAGLRVTLGVPSFDAELSDQTVPNETGFTSLAVNFKKGCYVGQELVERIDSRGGNVPKQLSWIRLATGAVENPVDDLNSDETELVRTIQLTTVVRGLTDSDLIGLSYADRKTLARGTANADIDGRVCAVSVQPVLHS